MGVRVSWDNEAKTIIRYDFEDPWEWAEFYAMTGDAFALTRSVEHTVDSISYFTPGATMPPNALMNFRRAMVNAPKNRGVTVIVGGSMFVRTMVRVFSKVYRELGERLLLADSLDQARALLMSRRK